MTRVQHVVEHGKMLKLLEALSESHERPTKDGDHVWRQCRLCNALSEVRNNANARQLIRDAAQLLREGSAESRLQELEARERVLMDIHDALGIQWGEDPYARIAELKREGSAERRAEWRPISMPPSVEGGSSVRLLGLLASGSPVFCQFTPFYRGGPDESKFMWVCEGYGWATKPILWMLLPPPPESAPLAEGAET